MNRTPIVCAALVAFVAMLLTLLAGCPKPADNGAANGPAFPTLPQVSESGDTVNHSGSSEMGKAVSGTAKQEGREVKAAIKTHDGTVTATTRNSRALEKKCGIAFYPGAYVDAGTNAQQSGEKAETTQTITLKAPFPVATVAAFYRGKYDEGNNVTQVGEGVLIYTNKNNGTGGKLITVEGAPEGTQIRIMYY